jgi:hypothetical protein
MPQLRSARTSKGDLAEDGSPVSPVKGLHRALCFL